MKTNINAHITLVGAGPGDLELITVKGLNAIKKANVILYDALVNEELLEYAPIAKKIFVGKRKGFKAYSQEEINQLLVESAQTYGNAVRLKGGDSFVFGRGSEEIIYAQELGISTQIIPGISSSISVPALANIPVTHRGISNSFHVFSATLANGELNPELYNAADLNGTVVILMGISKLSDIVEIYSSRGKQDSKIAIISNGSLPNQQELSGEIGSILERYETNPIPAPGVIVIGEVVGVIETLNSEKLEAIYK
ncbi:MAG: uroporphyrinogen-III C-methyltransferase [Flavobacteriia bacterium]|jgi:uroporphyrin-III C-methyltransferase